MLGIKSDKDDTPAAASSSNADRYKSALPVETDGRRRPVSCLSRCDGYFRSIAVRSDKAFLAVDNHLWCIRSIAETSPILRLALRRHFHGKWIGPAQTVPIGHVKGERQDIASLRKLGQKSVRWRARRAAFRGEKFHDNGALHGHRCERNGTEKKT
jgi:hypothetical protein